MQVAFDSTYVRFEEELDKSRKAREEKKRELVRAILAVKPRGSTDFETLTALYRQIFTYLLHVSRGGSGLPGAPSNTTAAEDPGSMERAVEREIAAALESVFPRIGLKSFVQLSSEEKRLQLEELARIVTGIRLFNREGGKGGAGLDHVEDAVATTPPGVAPAQLERWAQELANRRQYGAYLTSLAEDAAASERRVQVHRERFATEMDELQALVGGRASVPKEHVYPKFDAIATAWFALDDELRVVESRVATLEELHQFRESYNMTCGANHPVYRAARLESHAKPDGGAPPTTRPRWPRPCPSSAATRPRPRSRRPSRARRRRRAPPRTTTPRRSTTCPRARDNADVPVRLSVETTPEFMQLPLEYQGFCGWTVANRHGLLLPGKPALGVVKYRGSCYVFAHAVALKAFMDAPEAVREGVVAQATLAPELVHLLRLQDSYPGTSIAKILASRAITGKGAEPGQATAVAKALLAPAATRDASTDTPVHFVEKHIDPAYEWNDWALRRRALRLAQLKHCATTSQQTDESHFRRNNTTQVFLPKIASTQSRKDGETNPPVRIQYFKKGLRGGPNKIVNPEEKPLETVNVDLTYHF
ncbi:zinc ion transmembrane transporter [Aureococcus anophagefferens]|nr:zinc ion transmembrane transporter [Aureococcus anophagefferens]